MIRNAMNKDQRQVREWMLRAGQECPGKPAIPSLKVRFLRARLIMEEALETIEALGLEASVLAEDEIFLHQIKKENVGFSEGFSEGSTPDLTAIADGIADLQVVSLGAAVACGIDIEPVFDEVMRSNNSKWWGSSELDYANHPNYKFTPIGDNLYCATDRDGKVMKSPSFSIPNINPIIEAQCGTGIEK